MMNLYEKYNLKVGLEIHFQLHTGRKLFCKCPPEFSESPEGIKLIRRLRPTQSELGQIDPAALFEFEKGLMIEYIAPAEYTCLVETDEEPPHYPDVKSIEVALRLARFFNMKIVDEIQFMRKIVVDGSNTTGFQRTAVVAYDGTFTLNNKKYGVQTITVEEEAARLIERRQDRVVYSLDRLGIPLIEVATAPDINSPEEAVKVAKYIGRLVRSTGYKRRGLGSVRQDVNISISGGNIVEIKGIQKLDTLGKVIEYEFNRHIKLLELRELLIKSGLTPDSLEISEFTDVSEALTTSQSRIVRRILKDGGRFYAVKISGFRGFLGYKVVDKTFAREILERIRFWTGVTGLFHSDELPNYGISSDEVGRIGALLNLGDRDAFIMIGIFDEDQLPLIRDKIIERMMEAFEGVPYETRGATEDGKTFYMRPRPGMARMYPETDIPPIIVDDKLLENVSKIRIVEPEDTISRLKEEFGLSDDMAEELLDNDLVELFTELFNNYGEKIGSGYIYHVLVSIPKALEREGYDISKVDEDVFRRIFKALSDGDIVKESIEDILKSVCEGVDIDRSIEKYRSAKVSVDEVRNYLREVLNQRSDISHLPPKIKKKRLIGIAMEKYRGLIDAKVVVNIVEELINE